MTFSRHIALALTGASGMPYGVRLLECLLAAELRVSLVYSEAAQIVAKEESALILPDEPKAAEAVLKERFSLTDDRLHVYGKKDWFSPLASGSGAPDTFIVCPCSMGTLAAISYGLSDSLIERAADVVLKEGKKLILVPRESPFSTLHLENMLRLSKMGATMVPPSPGFYHAPHTISDLVDFVVAKILDQAKVPHSLFRPWGS